MTDWSDSGTAFGGSGINRAVLVGLIGLGWLYALAQVLTMEAGGSLAQAGPGMDLFAYAKAHMFGDPFAFEISLSLCVTPVGAWTALDVLKGLAMWLGMVLAMMLPVLWRGVEPVPSGAFLTGIAGYVAAWVPFCVAGVAVQWGLHGLGAVNGHYVLQDRWIIAAVLGLVALGMLGLGAAPLRAVCAPGASQRPFRAGWRHGMVCLRCCGPLMLVMFVAGLMNILAMLVLTGVMVALMRRPGPVLARGIGVAAVVGAMISAMLAAVA